MPALNRALALDKRHDGAVHVAEQLHLDVARPLEPAFEVHRAVAKRRHAPRTRAARSADGRSAGAPTVRMPLPPPPATALSISG